MLSSTAGEGPQNGCESRRSGGGGRGRGDTYDEQGGNETASALPSSSGIKLMKNAMSSALRRKRHRSRTQRRSAPPFLLPTLHLFFLFVAAAGSSFCPDPVRCVRLHLFASSSVSPHRRRAQAASTCTRCCWLFDRFDRAAASPAPHFLCAQHLPHNPAPARGTGY